MRRSRDTPITANHIDRWLLLVVVVTAIAYIALTPRIFERLDPMTGDEPFYVMTAVSLARDFDLDESNNYAQRDYDEFYRSPPLPAGWQGWTRLAPTLSPHEAVTAREGQYSKHGLGLPLLIAAPFELVGRTGAVAVVIAFGVALAGQIYLLARQAASSRWLAAVIALGLALLMPIVPYTHLLFPEVPAALCLIYAIRRVASAENTRLQWLLCGGAIGFVPWLHQRFVPTAIILALVIAVRFVRSRAATDALTAFVPIAVGGLALVGFNLWLYRSPVQPAENHDGFSSLTGAINGAFGLLLDAQWGLLVIAPLMVLGIAALPWWVETDRDTARIAALAVGPYLILLAVYSSWWGSWGPPARYLVPIVPLAAGPLAAWLSRASLAGRSAAAILWLAGAGFTIIGLSDPQRFYHQPNGVNNLVAHVDDRLGSGLAGRLVAFQTLDPSPVGDRVLAGSVAIAILTIAIILIAVVPRFVSTPTTSTQRTATRAIVEGTAKASRWK